MPIASLTYESFMKLGEAIEAGNPAAGVKLPSEYGSLNFSEDKGRFVTSGNEAYRMIWKQVMYQLQNVTETKTGATPKEDYKKELLKTQKNIAGRIAGAMLTNVAAEQLKLALEGGVFGGTAGQMFNTGTPGAGLLPDPSKPETTGLIKSKNWGAIPEEGFMGQPHGVSALPDSAEQIKDTITSLTQIPLMEEFEFKGSLLKGEDMATLINVGQGSITWTGGNFPQPDAVMRVLFTVWKMYVKMNNFLYFSMAQKAYTPFKIENGRVTEDERVHLSFRAIILFTELYLKKIIELITASLYVRYERIDDKPTIDSDGVTLVYKARAVIGSRTLPFESLLTKLTSIYLMKFNIVGNFKWEVDTETRNAFWGAIKKGIPAIQLPDNLYV